MADKNNYTDGVVVKGSAKADDIYNSGSNVTINAGAGDDEIINYGSAVKIDGGKGDDYILNFEDSSGDDADDSWGDDADDAYGEETYYGDDLDDDTADYSYDTADDDGKAPSTLLGGDGNDFIDNGITRDEDGSIIGWLYTQNVTIDGGKGDDFIANSGEKTLIKYSGGNDTISGFDVDDTLKIASGTMNSVVTTDGNNLFLKVGNDTITTNYASKVTISGGKGNDSIINGYGENVLFKYAKGDGNDIIEGFNETSTLQITSGKMNSVVNSNGSDYFLTVGSGKITLAGATYLDKVNVVNSSGKAINFTVKAVNDVRNFNDNAKLNGTANRDYFYNFGNKVSISGGDGNDTFIYKPGEGTDTIFDYTSGDTLTILKSNGKSGGTFTDSAFSDGALTLTISGGGNVVFNNVSASDKFNINGKSYSISNSKLK